MNKYVVERGQHSSELSLTRKVFRFTPNSLADLEFNRDATESSSENDAVRRSLSLARKIIEIRRGAGLYTKVGDTFVEVEFLDLAK